MTDKEIRKKINDGKITGIPQATLMAYLESRDVIQGLPQNAIEYLILNGMADKVPGEDLELWLENKDARELYSLDGINNLYKAICCRAVEDYKEILKQNLSPFAAKTNSERRETLEKFLGSEFFLNNSGCSSKEEVLEAIRSEMKRKAQIALVHS